MLHFLGDAPRCAILSARDMRTAKTMPPPADSRDLLEMEFYRDGVALQRFDIDLVPYSDVAEAGWSQVIPPLPGGLHVGSTPEEWITTIALRSWKAASLSRCWTPRTFGPAPPSKTPTTPSQEAGSVRTRRPNSKLGMRVSSNTAPNSQRKTRSSTCSDPGTGVARPNQTTSRSMWRCCATSCGKGQTSRGDSAKPDRPETRAQSPAHPAHSGKTW